MAFSLPPLPYDYGVLEPYIDTTTMQIHHDKHHATYVNNLNAATEKFPELRDLGIVDLNKAIGSSKIPSDVATAVRCGFAFEPEQSWFDEQNRIFSLFLRGVPAEGDLQGLC